MDRLVFRGHEKSLNQYNLNVDNLIIHSKIGPTTLLAAALVFRHVLRDCFEEHTKLIIHFILHNDSNDQLLLVLAFLPET